MTWSQARTWVLLGLLVVLCRVAVFAGEGAETQFDPTEGLLKRCKEKGIILWTWADGQNGVVLVVKGAIKFASPRNKRFSGPMEVWKIPVNKAKEPQWKKAIFMDRLAQVYQTEVNLVAAVCGDKLFCAYSTLWDTDRYVTFRAVSLTTPRPGLRGTPVEVTIDGKKQIGEVLEMPPPKRLALVYDLEGEEVGVASPVPLSLRAIDGKRLHLVIQAEHGELFAVDSTDGGKTWGKAKWISKPDKPVDQEP